MVRLGNYSTFGIDAEIFPAYIYRKLRGNSGGGVYLPPRVDLAVLGDAERVRATGSQRDPVHGRLYLRRRLPWVLFAAGAELPGRVVAKRPQLPLARQRERVRRARHHLRHRHDTG